MGATVHHDTSNTPPPAPPSSITSLEKLKFMERQGSSDNISVAGTTTSTSSATAVSHHQYGDHFETVTAAGTNGAASATDDYVKGEFNNGGKSICCQKYGCNLYRAWEVFRKLVKFIFTHLGLLNIVVAYCILGGVLFEYLEHDHEIKVYSSR